MTARPPLVGFGPLLLLLLLLPTACGKERSASHLAQGSPAADKAADTADDVLSVTGDLTFTGPSSYFCVPNPEGGVQIDYRTGDPAFPAVAVRLASYRGSGPYPARLFVNGRSASGALVTSAGSAQADVRQENAGAAVLLNGTFRGEYRGDAGMGEIRGSFRSCGYSAGPGVSVQDGAPPLAAEGPADDAAATLSSAAPSH